MSRARALPFAPGDPHRTSPRHAWVAARARASRLAPPSWPSYFRHVTKIEARPGQWKAGSKLARADAAPGSVSKCQMWMDLTTKVRPFGSHESVGKGP